MTPFLRSCAIVGTTLITVASFQAHAASKTLSYNITRAGDSIGTHTIKIDSNGSTTEVNINTDIKVKVFFITAYKFIHTSKEVWKNGALISLKSTTDDDGTQKALNAKAEKGQITLDGTTRGRERRQTIKAAAIPASLWNQAIVKQTTIFNTLDGTLMKIRVTDKGMEDIRVKGQTVSAHHYNIAGELTRDLWYNNDGDLVQYSFPDKTTKKIVYALN